MHEEEKRKRNTVLIAVICICAACIIAAYRFYAYFFQSSYVESYDSTSYTIAAIRLNSTVSHSFDLSEGDIVTITVGQSSGKLSFAIAQDEDNILILEEDAASATYTAEIPEDGTYTMAVKGSRGAGAVVFAFE